MGRPQAKGRGVGVGFRGTEPERDGGKGVATMQATAIQNPQDMYPNVEICEREGLTVVYRSRRRHPNARTRFQTIAWIHDDMGKNSTVCGDDREWVTQQAISEAVVHWKTRHGR